MKFKYAVILSTILCVVITSTPKHFHFYTFDNFFEFMVTLIIANSLSITYLLVKRKQKKSNLAFFVLQNILTLLSSLGHYLGSNYPN